MLDASHARALNAIERGRAASPRLVAELAEAGLVTDGSGQAPTITPAGRAALKASGPVDARGVLAAVRREPLNGLSFFYAGWVCGVLSFATGIGPLIAVGGALLIVAGALAARRDDVLARQFARAPGPWTGTAGARIFAGLVIAAIGVGWLVIGVA